MSLDNQSPLKGGPITRAAGIVLLCCISGLVGAALTRGIGSTTHFMSYSEFVSVMLTAVTVILTALAIMFAIAGVIGWQSIEKKAQDRVDAFLSREFGKDGRWTQIIEDRMDKLATGIERDAHKKVDALIANEMSKAYVGVQEPSEDQDDDCSGGGHASDNENNSSAEQEK